MNGSALLCYAALLLLGYVCCLYGLLWLGQFVASLVGLSITQEPEGQED